jgi:hypothetical protein
MYRPHVTRGCAGIALVFLLSVGACNGDAPGKISTAAVSAVTSGSPAPAATSNAARAVADAAGAKRFRDIAEAHRQLAAAYAKVTTDWNDKLKANAITRAAAADDIATRYQSRADYHQAEAAKEAAQ